MADVALTKIAGEGGLFCPTGGIVSDVLPSGQTGLLLSLPEVLGKYYKITSLSVGNSISSQAGISLIVNGETIEDEKTLDDQEPNVITPSSSAFLVSQLYSNSSIGASRFYKEIYCTSFSVLKNAGNTAQPIAYVFEIGEKI